MEILFFCTDIKALQRIFADSIEVFARKNYRRYYASTLPRLIELLKARPSIVIVYGVGNEADLDEICRTALRSRFPVLYVYQEANPSGRFNNERGFLSVNTGYFLQSPLTSVAAMTY